MLREKSRRNNNSTSALQGTLECKMWKKELKFGQKEGECFLMENWQIEYCDLTGIGNRFNVESGPDGEGVEGKVSVFKYFQLQDPPLPSKIKYRRSLLRSNCSQKKKKQVILAAYSSMNDNCD